MRDALKKFNEIKSGDHHFYITLLTNHPGVKIPDYLKEQYPESITIVLQYEFWDLKIEAQHFEVSLCFDDINETLVIPFSAVTNFVDPSVKFGLEFDPVILPEEAPITPNDPPIKNDGKSNVIDISAFRKK